MAVTSKSGPLALTITLRTMHLPGMAGSCLISRDKMPSDLEAIVEKALRTKIPKLVATAADKRILLLERDQIALGDHEIYRQIVKLAGTFPISPVSTRSGSPTHRSSPRKTGRILRSWTDGGLWNC